MNLIDIPRKSEKLKYYIAESYVSALSVHDSPDELVKAMRKIILDDRDVAWTELEIQYPNIIINDNLLHNSVFSKPKTKNIQAIIKTDPKGMSILAEKNDKYVYDYDLYIKMEKRLKAFKKAMGKESHKLRVQHGF